jgi:hypothetical protein
VSARFAAVSVRPSERPGLETRDEDGVDRRPGIGVQDPRAQRAVLFRGGSRGRGRGDQPRLDDRALDDTPGRRGGRRRGGVRRDCLDDQRRRGRSGCLEARRDPCHRPRALDRLDAADRSLALGLFEDLFDAAHDGLLRPYAG